MFKKSELVDDVFIIAEVGQNHQGDLDTAREYIKVFASLGADAIKFQTRCNKYLFDDFSYNASYESENAFAETYGAHREMLELKPEWLPALRDDCHKLGVKFMSTPFDEPSLQLLLDTGVDVLKIASFDLGNLPLIERIAESNVPTVISVGGGKSDQIASSVETIAKFPSELAILHCVSEYPCEYNRLGLDNIEVLAERYPDYVVGLSDHFNGTLSGPIAYTKGARVFEKHVTFNRSWRGTDHSFSLEPDGFRKFCRDIRRVTHMMNPKPPEELGSEMVFKKLGKSLIASTKIGKGEVVSSRMLSGRIFKDQILPVRDSNLVIGKTAKRDIEVGEAITLDLLD